MRHQGSECSQKGGARTEPWDKTQRGQGDKEEQAEKERPERGEENRRMQYPGSHVKKAIQELPLELKNDQLFEN